MDIECHIENQRHRLHAQRLVALQSIQEARAELDYIETEVENAAHERPFTEIDQINILDANAVLAVMGTATSLKRMVDWVA